MPKDQTAPTPTATDTDPALFADTPPVEAPPARPAPTAKGSAPRKPGRPAKAVVAIEERTRRISAAYQQLGAALMLAGVGFGNVRMLAAGEVMETNAEQLGAAWAQWADTSPQVARIVDSIAGGGAAGAVLLAHLPIVRAIMAPEPLEGIDTSALGDLGAMFQQFSTEPPPAS